MLLTKPHDQCVSAGLGKPGDEANPLVLSSKVPLQVIEHARFKQRVVFKVPRARHYHAVLKELEVRLRTLQPVSARDRLPQ